jgi:hypothetical protein
MRISNTILAGVVIILGIITFVGGVRYIYPYLFDALLVGLSEAALYQIQNVIIWLTISEIILS